MARDIFLSGQWLPAWSSFGLIGQKSFFLPALVN